MGGGDADRMKKGTKHLALFLTVYVSLAAAAQETGLDYKVARQKSERALHYKPEGKDFVLVEGKRRFNRALYGSNTAFRVEAGDLPEFALYLPGMGGNLKFGIIQKGKSKWLTGMEVKDARYRPGSMQYLIGDELLQQGTLRLNVIPLHTGEGMIIKLEA